MALARCLPDSCTSRKELTLNLLRWDPSVRRGQYASSLLTMSCRAADFIAKGVFDWSIAQAIIVL